MESFPWAWYADEAVFRAEQERIFRRTWQYAGHLGQLAEPGSWFICRAGVVPVVVTRDRADVLRAFVNVCRHRGFPVASGEGRRETLQCAYHAWTYGLDGSLRAAPRADREPAFEREELGLLPAAVDTWGPFVFVNADASAPPLAETLGEVPELVRSVGVDVDSLVYHSRVPYTLEANWKIAVENYLECYHCAVAHPGFSDVIDVAPDRYRLEPHSTFASQHVQLREGDGEGQFHMIWPNIKVNLWPGEPNLSIGRLQPIAPDRTDGFLDYFFGPDPDPAWLTDFFEMDNQVGAEDRGLVESVQRGMRSGAFERGELLLPSEELIAEFQRWVSAGLE
jgi:carnitine monooxygenase subunit